MVFDIEKLLQFVFWISFLGICHTYLIYPKLIIWWLNRRKFVQNYSQTDHQDQEWPEMNVVMAMYNEESVIQKTLQSITASDYPDGKLKIYVGSDNSTDGSHQIVKVFMRRYPAINLEIFKGRSGKIKIINQLVEKIPVASGSIVVLCDANVVWTQSLAKKLARHFCDEAIGIVASTVIDDKHSKRGIGNEEEAYVNRENLVKYGEGKLWGRMMGAFGACYAMRRAAFEPVPANYNVDDFYQTMVCYEKGYRGIVDLEAICYEAVSEDISEEFRRKRRISKGNFQNLIRFWRYLQPWNCGLATFFAFWSHKGLRWFGAWLLILAMMSCTWLAISGYMIYQAACLVFLATFVATGIDKLMETCFKNQRISVFKFVRYFYAMNAALFLGSLEFCLGVRNSIWEPTKRVAPQSVSSTSSQSN
jgi:cellulose synthase/poly-beta-1,6-N-acetylglucosamine synthase-like glycosyltransferase